MTRRRELTLEDYAQGIRAGDRAILARGITLVESTAPADEALAQELLTRLLPWSGLGVRVGITGAPGVGKSSLIEALGTRLTAGGQRVAVLAVDPSSPLSGGSILGDKTRMTRLAGDERAFIRPSPAGGRAGGVARATREAIVLLEAAGYGVVLVETVGVGQGETAVHAMVDFLLLLMLAGSGDALQGIKRGVVELCDALAITKADGDNRARAEAARQEFAGALHTLAPREGGECAVVLTCSAVTGEGLAAIWQLVTERQEAARRSGALERRRREQALHWMRAFIAEQLERRFYLDPAVAALLPGLEREVIQGALPPRAAALRLLEAARRGDHA